MEQEMTTLRPFRFGTGAYLAKTRDEYIALVRKVEDLGYSILLTPDHFGEQLAVLPALMAAAEATPTLRIGGYVFANDFRHPTVLANECATVDLLCGGRFEFGIGAGYLGCDARFYGFRPCAPLHPAVAYSTRAARDDPLPADQPGYAPVQRAAVRD